MVVLSDRSIWRRVDGGDLDISPMGDKGKQIQPCSVDLRLADQYYDPDRDRVFDGENAAWIGPGDFLLGATIERVRLPRDLCALVKGRSSIGRTGLQIHNAGWVDAGFEGELTLELINFSEETVKVTKGQRICQIAFLPLDRQPLRDYGQREDSKYQGQEGVTKSRIEQEREREAADQKNTSSD